MPLLPLAIVLFVLVALVLAMPFLLVQRYRIGKARRKARGWIADVNLVAFALSAGIFLWASAITSLWVPMAFFYSLVGLFAGGLLGMLGLALTHWEEASERLYYTPNRWLILILTLAVATRLLYSIWRGWQAWHARGPDGSWLAASGAAGSLAVGAVVLGYYLAYSGGVRRRLKHHRNSRER